jgi:hypothetical protein
VDFDQGAVGGDQDQGRLVGEVVGIRVFGGWALGWLVGG